MLPAMASSLKADISNLSPSEQICAMQHRKVYHRWLSSRNIDKAFLSKDTRWPTHDRCRDDEEGEDDIIEVETAELQEPDGK